MHKTWLEASLKHKFVYMYDGVWLCGCVPSPLMVVDDGVPPHAPFLLGKQQNVKQFGKVANPMHHF